MPRVNVSGSSTPSARSQDLSRFSPICRATPIGRDLQLTLVALDDRGVTFRWKDYREHGRTRYKTMSLATEEFMRRFLLQRVALRLSSHPHYGLLANANRQHDIAAARDLLHQPAPTPPAAPGDGGTDHGCPRPTFVCRHCGAPMPSSRPSRALSTSVAHRVHRAHHDRHRVNQQHFSTAAFSSMMPSRTPVASFCKRSIVGTTIAS